MSTTENDKYPYEFGKSKIRCVGDRIIVRKMGVMVSTINENVKDFERRTEKDQWDIAIDHPYKGQVVMVGDGKISGIEMNPPTVEVGDVIYSQRPFGNRVRIDTGEGIEQLYVLREADCDIVISKPEIQIIDESSKN